jgi:hypothetical protein
MCSCRTGGYCRPTNRTDIHEHVENLRSALDSFAGQKVDQVVVIGDVCETGEWIEETCRLLAEAGAVGVWGNHDFGMCVEPTEKIRTKYPAVVLDFMTSHRPRLDIEGCYFAHVEPRLNPEELADLWYFDGPPDEHGKLDRIFDAVPHRIMFAGHYHKWLLAAPDGVKDRKGDRGQFAERTILRSDRSVMRGPVFRIRHRHLGIGPLQPKMNEYGQASRPPSRWGNAATSLLRGLLVAKTTGDLVHVT